MSDEADHTAPLLGRRLSPGQHLIAAWGIVGVCLLLVQALIRLTPHALEAMAQGMAGWQWAIFVVWVGVNTYAEGYRGFHTRFSPRVVQRAFWLARHPRPLHVAVAPLYCMSWFHASRRARLVAWMIVLLVLGAVVLVRRLDQPWRGIVDAGVVTGLAWGLVAILGFWSAALARDPGRPPDLPG